MIAIRDLEFAYTRSDFCLRVPELMISAGARVAIVGPSGCGKTTLLSLIAGILVPGSGSVRIDGSELTTLTDAARRAVHQARRFGIPGVRAAGAPERLGQHPAAVPHQPGTATGQKRPRAPLQLADQVGISDKLRRCVRRLSQGERQRVAICRALLPTPRLLLCDEPTGNLDAANKQHILDILDEYASRVQATLVTVTHDSEIIERFSRIVDFPDFSHATGNRS